MDIRKLQRVVVDALEDVKGADIRVFNSMGLTQLFDRVIIASGTSNRQTRALAASVRDKVKSAGGQVLSVEGEETGEWVLVDLGDAIVHIMQPTIRAYYNLEELWGVKPVAMKSHDEGSATVHREAAHAEPAKKTERTVIARKTSGNPAAKKSPARAVARHAAKKSPPRKSAPGKAASRGAAGAGASAPRSTRKRTASA